MSETARRRGIQEAYNKEHGIVPKTIIKEIRDLISISKPADKNGKGGKISVSEQYDELSKKEKADVIMKLEHEMREAAKSLDFERAATLRDTVLELKAGNK